MTRILHDATDVDIASASADGEALRLDRADVERATGWTWKPQGLCRDDTCMPLPRDPVLADGDRLDVAGVWRRAGWPVAHDRAGGIWVLGESADARAAALSTLDAPDVGLPDLAGRMHRLSDFRGRRVFLVAWASW